MIEQSTGPDEHRTAGSPCLPGQTPHCQGGLQQVRQLRRQVQLDHEANELVLVLSHSLQPLLKLLLLVGSQLRRSAKLMLANEVVSDIFACYLNGQRGAARCWKETTYICWNGYGRRGTSSLPETCARIYRFVRLGFRSKRPRRGVLYLRGTAKQHGGPRAPSDTNVFTSVRGTEGGRNTFITLPFSKRFKSTTA